MPESKAKSMRRWTHNIRGDQPLQWRNQLWQNMQEGCRKARRGVCVGGHIRGDKECPFNGVNSHGRIWKKGARKRFGVCNDS